MSYQKYDIVRSESLHDRSRDGLPGFYRRICPSPSPQKTQFGSPSDEQRVHPSCQTEIDIYDAGMAERERNQFAAREKSRSTGAESRFPRPVVDPSNITRKIPSELLDQLPESRIDPEEPGKVRGRLCPPQNSGVSKLVRVQTQEGKSPSPVVCTSQSDVRSLKKESSIGKGPYFTVRAQGPIPYRRSAQPERNSSIISSEIPNQKSSSIVSQSSPQGTVFGICRYLRPAQPVSSIQPQFQQSCSIGRPVSKFQQSGDNESKQHFCNNQIRVRNSNSLSSEGSRNSQYSVQNSSIYFDDENSNDQDEYIPGDVNDCYNINVNIPDEHPQTEVNECYNVNVKAPKTVIISNFHDFCQTMLSVDGVEGDTFGHSLRPSETQRNEKLLSDNPKATTTEPEGFSDISNIQQEYLSDHNKSRISSNPRLYKPPEFTSLQAQKIHVSTSPHFTSSNGKKHVEDSLVPKIHGNNNDIYNHRSIEIQKPVEKKLGLPKSLSSPSLQSPGIVKEVLKKMASHSNPEGCSSDFVFLDENSGRNYRYSSKDHGRSDAEALRIIQDLDRSLDEALPPSNESTPVSQSKHPHFSTLTSGQNRSPVEVEDDESQTDNLVEEIYLQSNNKKSADGLPKVKTGDPNQKAEDKKQQKQKFRRTTDAAVNTVVERAVRRNSEPPKGSQEQANRKDTSLSKVDNSPRKKLDERPPVPPKNFSLSEELVQHKKLNSSPRSENHLPTPNTHHFEAEVTSLTKDYFENSIVANTSTSSVDSGTSSPQQGHFVVVAVDFGTTYSGYAFSFIRDPANIHMMRKWEGGDPGVPNQKTPTTLLLTPGGEFHSFGFTARDFYHDLDGEEAKRWLYFEKFKMTLHNNENLSRDTPIRAANGKTLPAVQVFAHALRYFKTHALQELSDQTATEIVNEDIRWVVTVPAIWRQPAKQFMRTAAYEAGIGSPDNPDQLLIALEPEAASIYCRKLRIHQLVPEAPSPRRLSIRQVEPAEIISDPAVIECTGTRYMVVDCGGGTVDITVHELLNQQGSLKELYKATGGPYGSIGVDQEFENLLNSIFGVDFIEQYKLKRPAGYVDLMIAFEARKRNASPFKSNPLNISLPFSFIDYYKKYKNSSVESAIKKYGQKNVKWSSQGMLRLEPSAMFSLFQNTVHMIKQHIANILNNTTLGKIDYIFLVGGFAESQFVQKEIRDAFFPHLKVVIPQGVSLAIVKGAVLFGLDPTIVNVRRSRMTYGVGVLNRFIHGVHPLEKLIVKDGVEWCTDVFDKFVVSDQSVGLGDIVLRSYTPAKAGQACSIIHIYCSELDDVHFITDPGVKKCGSLMLDLSDSKYLPRRREIQTRMVFGDTEIKVTALDVVTGTCVKADIDFLNN